MKSQKNQKSGNECHLRLQDIPEVKRKENAEKEEEGGIKQSPGKAKEMKNKGGRLSSVRFTVVLNITDVMCI